MQLSELMISSPHNCSMYFVNKIWKIVIVLFKHVKHVPIIKIYQSKHYSAFIQTGYILYAIFTFS